MRTGKQDPVVRSAFRAAFTARLENAFPPKTMWVAVGSPYGPGYARPASALGLGLRHMWFWPLRELYVTGSGELTVCA